MVFVCLLALLVFLATSSAFFPDLSSVPSNATVLQLGGLSITEVPAGTFARFTALQALCVTVSALCASALLVADCAFSGCVLESLTVLLFAVLPARKLTQSPPHTRDRHLGNNQLTEVSVGLLDGLTFLRIL
jgi:hypothetical protein